MMKKNTLALMLSACLTVPSMAMAAGTDPGFYAGAGYTFATLENNDFDSDTDLGVLFVRGGYQFNQYVAVEARLGEGVQDDKIQGLKLEIDNMYGAYAKVGLPTEIGLYPYVLLGMTHAEVKASARGFSDTTSDSDVSYGIGADYWFNKQLSAGLEYANLYDTDGVTVSGFTLGVNYKF
jgi:opacity protein-like surface antigen